MRLLIIVFLSTVALAQAPENPWAAVRQPLRGSDDKQEVIGGYSSGCIRNARDLAISNRYWEVVNVGRNRHYGHTDIVELLNFLGQWSVDQAQHGKLVLGDISQPAGGPMPYGHASHQLGLDADIRFAFAPLGEKMDDAKREGYPYEPVARHAVHRTLGKFDMQSTLVANRWKPAYGELVAKAAEFPKTERIFVSPPIKKALCDLYKPEKGKPYPTWLNKVSPYFGHDGHLHVRLKCPPDAVDCKKQGAVPVDKEDPTRVGCAGPRLDHWLDSSGKKGTYMAKEMAEFLSTEDPDHEDKDLSSEKLKNKLSNLPEKCRSLIAGASSTISGSSPPRTEEAKGER